METNKQTPSECRHYKNGAFAVHNNTKCLNTLFSVRYGYQKPNCPDYEQKKRECFVQFCKDNGIDQEVNISIFDAFDQIFDRAYALGKQTETVTQEEIESHSVGYATDVNNAHLSAYPEAIRPQLYPEYDMDDLANAFEAGANFALGKQETKQEVDAEETVISGWVARDKDDDVFLYQNQPDRNEIAWNGYMMHSLPTDSFPDLTWESEPLPVEIILKRKKK